MQVKTIVPFSGAKATINPINGRIIIWSRTLSVEELKAGVEKHYPGWKYWRKAVKHSNEVFCEIVN